MKSKISWTQRCEDGVKREVRVHVTRGGLTWQFKRADEERWDYESPPGPDDWDALEDYLARREQRGKGAGTLEAVRRLRKHAGA